MSSFHWSSASCTLQQCVSSSSEFPVMRMDSEGSDTWCVFLVLHRRASLTEPIRRPCSVAVVFQPLSCGLPATFSAARLPGISSPLEDPINTMQCTLQYQPNSDGNIRAVIAVGEGTRVSWEGSPSKSTHLYTHRHTFMAIALRIPG